MTALRPPIKPSPRPARVRLGITTGVGALAASVLVIALGTNAFASIPGPGGIISGCYVKTGGALSVIDSTQKCGSNQTSVN